MEAIAVAKAAAAVVKNKDSIGKIIGIAIGIAVTPIVLVVALYLYVMSAFAPDGLLQSSEYFDAATSEIHESLQEVLTPYYQTLREDMLSRKQRIMSEKKRVVRVDGANGVSGSQLIIPTVKIRINYVPENLIIAYLIMVDGINVETAEIDADAVNGFLGRINSIEEIDQGNDAWLVENKILTVEEIANLYFQTESEKTQFTVTANAYAEYFDVSTTTVVDPSGAETEEYNPISAFNAVPLYLQYDSAWGAVPYGNGTIKRNGCCPTCLAMVFSYLNQQAIYPNDVVAWAGNRYYVNGAGTAWSIFTPAAEHWGVTCTNIGKDQIKMQQALGSGKLVIASMGPGTFTKGGHFIVLTGVTGSGKITVNDPNDNSTKKHYDKAFDVSLIMRESKCMWVFGKE